MGSRWVWGATRILEKGVLMLFFEVKVSLREREIVIKWNFEEKKKENKLLKMIGQYRNPFFVTTC